MLKESFSLFENQVFVRAVEIAWSLWPVWLPVLFLRAAFQQWMDYKRREWIKGQGSVLLEIRLPNEILKSPVSMELFLQALHQSGVGSVSDIFFKGRVRQWFSLELVSDGGKVHFYIWGFASTKKSIETQLYALFPNIEVKEAKDYAVSMPYDPVKYKYGRLGNMKLTKKDVYPLKTYIDYGLDKDPKEEFKHDPMAPMIEYLGSLKPGEHAWIQILVQAHTKENYKYGHLIPRPDWKGRAEKEIKDEILGKAKFKGPEEKQVDPKFLSDEQRETIKAIERSLSKPAFDTMIRAFYFAETDKFNPVNIGGILGAFKSFSSNTLNGIMPGKGTSGEYPWQDFLELLKKANERKFLDAYKRRSYFNPPHEKFGDAPYVLTTEEVATLYHFPSAMAVATPTLSRIPSKKAEAPANLPI